MKKCNILLGIVFAMCGLYSTSAKAQSASYLTVAYASMEQSHELGDLTKITFENGKMQAISSSGTIDYELASLEKLFFSETPTSVDSQLAENESVSYSNTDETLTLNGVSGAKVQIYQISGNLIKTSPVGSDNETISLSDLSKGIYLVKVNNKVIKIRK